MKQNKTQTNKQTNKQTKQKHAKKPTWNKSVLKGYAVPAPLIAHLVLLLLKILWLIRKDQKRSGM